MIFIGAGSVVFLALVGFGLQPQMESNADFGFDTQHQPRPDDHKPWTTDIDPRRLFDRDSATGRAR